MRAPRYGECAVGRKAPKGALIQAGYGSGTDLNIDDWRDEIDRLDEQLVKLLNARSQCAIELGRIKRELGLAIYSPDREREVIAHVTGINPGPLDRTAVRRLFERIIDESRRIERVTVEKEAKGENSGKRKKRGKGG